MLVKCDCPQVWEVFGSEEREDEAFEFSLYATVTIQEGTVIGGRFSVRKGERFSEVDRCPSCNIPLETVLGIEGFELPRGS